MGKTTENIEQNSELNNQGPLNENKNYKKDENNKKGEKLYTAINTVTFFESIANEMEGDELIKYVYRNKLYDEIFNKVDPLDFYYRVDLNNKRTTHSTKEVAVILGFNDSQRLINLYNRVDGILQYFQLERTGGGPRGFYRHSHVTLFKLFLYFYLLDVKGVKADDIHALLGLYYESNVIHDHSSKKANNHFDESRDDSYYNSDGNQQRNRNSDVVTREELKTEVGRSIYETNQMMMMFAESVNKNFKEISAVLKRQNELFANRLITTNNTFIDNLREQERYLKQHQQDLTKQIENIAEETQQLTIKTELVRFQYNQRLDIENELKNRLNEVTIMLNEAETERLLAQNSNDEEDTKKVGFFSRLFGGSVEPKIVTKVDFDRLIQGYKSEINIINQELSSPQNSEAIDQEKLLLQQQLKRKIEQAETLKKKLVEVQDAIITVTKEISNTEHKLAADEKLIEESNNESLHLQLDGMVDTLHQKLTEENSLMQAEAATTETVEDVIIEVMPAKDRG